MVAKSIRLLAILPLTVCLVSQAQTTPTTLAEVFERLRSSDPEIVDSAKSSIVDVVKHDMPSIEKDAAVICSALKDPDPYIRLQATGIISTIVRIAPEHTVVVSACAPNLLRTATDSEARVRNNSLFALVMNTVGPPAGSQGVFSNAMLSEDSRTSELAAVGMLRLGNEKVIIDALKNSTDSKRQLNLLYAIGAAQRRSEELFEVVQKYSFSDRSDIQRAAVDALIATSVDSAKTVAALNVIMDSRGTPSDTRTYAQAAVQKLNPQP